MDLKGFQFLLLKKDLELDLNPFPFAENPFETSKYLSKFLIIIFNLFYFHFCIINLSLTFLYNMLRQFIYLNIYILESLKEVKV